MSVHAPDPPVVPDALAVYELLCDDTAVDAATLARLLTPAQRRWRPAGVGWSVAGHAAAAVDAGERLLWWIARAEPAAAPGLPADGDAGGLPWWAWRVGASLARADAHALERLAAQQARVRAALRRLRAGPAWQVRPVPGVRVDAAACAALLVRHQRARLARAVALTGHPRFPGGAPLDPP